MWSSWSLRPSRQNDRDVRDQGNPADASAQKPLLIKAAQDVVESESSLTESVHVPPSDIQPTECIAMLTKNEFKWMTWRNSDAAWVHMDRLQHSLQHKTSQIKFLEDTVGRQQVVLTSHFERIHYVVNKSMQYIQDGYDDLTAVTMEKEAGTKRIAELQTEVEELSNVLDMSNNQHDHQVARLEKQLAQKVSEFESKVSDLQDMNYALKTLTDMQENSMTSLKNEVAGLQGAVSQYEARESILEQRLLETESTLDEYEAQATATVQRLNQDLLQCKVYESTLERELADSKAREADLIERLSHMQQALARSEASQTDIKVSLAQAQDEKAALKQEVIELKQAIDDKDCELLPVHQQLSKNMQAEADAPITQANTDIPAPQADTSIPATPAHEPTNITVLDAPVCVNVVITQAIDKDERLKALRTQAAVQEGIIVQLQGTIVALEDTVQLLQSKVESMTQKASKDCAEVDIKSKVLTARLDVKEDGIVAVRLSLADYILIKELTEKLSGHEQVVTDLRATIQTLTAQSVSKGKALAMLRDQINTLKGIEAAQDAVVTGLNAQVNSLKAQVEALKLKASWNVYRRDAKAPT